eukprot:TRINITY_DN15803_c0_g1_i1.p1 TRINITY_DN15803_c0_g1~~TRINITY_DN15803_c0_g1_i1.p1  ORF type:complete len:591 (-),score=95.33 TRINITY_DN15803_c0_g1_i1:200-1972(-)
MPWDDYQKMREIYMGSFGRTFLVHRSTDRRIMAMRQYEFAGMDQQMRLCALRDVQSLTSLKHPYLIRYSEKFIHETSLYMVFEEIEEGTLFTYIRMCSRQRALMPEAQVIRWFTQVCLAVKYLHERPHPILHRNITTQNIFLVKKESTEIKLLVEFGPMQVLDSPDSVVMGQVGTHFCQSPEICCREPYGTPADVWSLGCVLYEMCAAHLSWEAENIPEHIENIMIAPLSQISDWYSRELARIAAALLTHEAEERPSADMILKLPLLQEEIRKMLHARHKNKDQQARAVAEVKRVEKYGDDDAYARRPDAQRDGAYSARAREDRMVGTRACEEAYSARARADSYGARVREEACSARAREDSYSARVREETPGARIREDSFGAKIREDAPITSARPREDSFGARIRDDAPGPRAREGSYSARRQEEPQGARFREGSRGANARDGAYSARGREDGSSAAKVREDSYSARGSRPLGEHNPRMPHTARSASPCEAAKLLLMPNAPGQQPQPRYTPRTESPNPVPHHEAAAKLLLGQDRAPTPAYDPESAGAPGSRASRPQYGAGLAETPSVFATDRQGRRPRRASSINAGRDLN